MANVASVASGGVAALLDPLYDSCSVHEVEAVYEVECHQCPVHR